MELYLLRHGASVANERMLVCGAADYPLSPQGVKQAALACRQLEQVRFNRIYASPLSRARDTAAGLSVSVGLGIEKQLQELNTGAVSHITLPELWEQDRRYRKPWLSPDLRYPGGETFREMVSRVTGWFDTHSSGWDTDETVLIVGHEGTLRSIYLRLLRLPLHDYPDFPIGNCDHLYFNLQDGVVLRYAHVRLKNLEEQA